MTQTANGLYDKYEVYRDGEPVEECFVLEPADDPAAREALLSYASATDDDALSDELRKWAYDHILDDGELPQSGESDDE
ncbi:hypothetical protein EGH21_22485 [Halomicroarcula sp. F13]|uniref:Uncharacterized protein n=1 Tax=Haloarcula rubra TaxID=2487747 RepID=A0AAW4PXA0_9EURY|nr:hypothetical protein [Halomicroarcula rubra]MBX0325789.1 hypothetical protein [Halomicroarcula rubra]